MEWMLLGILAFGLFITGIVTVVYLLVRLCIRLFDPSSTAPAPRPVQPSKIPLRLTRTEELNIVVREIEQAAKTGRLSESAYQELSTYVAFERTNLNWKSGPASIPPVPEPVTPSLQPPPPAQRDPAAIRAAIARLHDHAQEPEQKLAEPAAAQTTDNETAPDQGRLVAPKMTAPVPFQSKLRTEGKKASSLRAASVAPPTVCAKPIARPAPVPQKLLAERLFTPENVRILQSLGIGLIFFSAVAYVRTQMWEGASALTQMALLLGGTVLCLGIGFAVRRWTELRITGLGFLILGHLSIVLDACAVMTPTGPGTTALYPFHPGSLWMLSLALFAASSYWHARLLNEPLFDAFAFFGVLAAWGAGAHWIGAEPWHLAAAFVPVVLACRFIPPLLSENTGPLQRWRFPWWMQSAWELGTPLLLIIELGTVTLTDPQTLTPELWLHLAAIVILGVAALWDGYASKRKWMTHWGAASLLAVWPLAAFVHQGALCELPMTLAIPAAALAWIALLFEQKTEPARTKAWSVLCAWGTFAVFGAALSATMARMVTTGAALSTTWSAGALLAVGVGLVFLRASSFGAWLTVAGGALLSAMLLDLTSAGLEWMPVLWLSLAMLGATLAARFKDRPLAVAAREQLDVLASGALIGGIFFWLTAPHAVWTSATATTGLHGPAPVYQFITWTVLAAYAWMTSFIWSAPWRRAAGVILTGPGLLYGLSALGLYSISPAVLTVALAVLAWLAVEGLNRREDDPELLMGGWIGTGVLLIQAFGLSLFHLTQGWHATLAGDLLALGGVMVVLAIRSRRACAETAWCVTLEGLALGFLAGTALSAAVGWNLTSPEWVQLLAGLSGGVLLLALAGERLVADAEETQPFRTAGEIVALLLSATGLGWEAVHPSGALHVLWLPALPMIFVAVREFRAGKAGTKLSTYRLTTIAAFIQLTITVVCGVGMTIQQSFWSSGLAASARTECILFYGLLMLLGLLSGIFLRSVAAPVLGGVAALALSACAYGGWKLSYETFGLPVMITAVTLVALGAWLRQHFSEQRDGQGRAAGIMGALAGLFGALYLLEVLAGGPKNELQIASVFSWLLAAVTLWYVGRRRLPFVCGLGGATALMLAGMHAMRWGGIEFTAFGPAIGAFALVLIGLREVAEFFDTPEGTKPVALRGRPGGLLIAAWCAILLAGFFGFAGLLDERPWHWVLTLGEGAFFLGALTILSRRRAAEMPAVLLFFVELAMWATALMALGFGLANAGCGSLLHGALWAGVGALVLLVGMMLESIAGGILGPAAHAKMPGAFLESRHVAAAGCALLALLTAMSDFQRAGLPGIWQACLGATLLAVYGSLCRPSVSPNVTRVARYGAGAAAYLILLPAGYLAFLASQSTGSSWGALSFMALAPALMGVAWLLEKEREPEQSLLAQWGALLVNAGALVLAFAKNRECLAAVPACTLLGLTLEALLLRFWRGRKEWSIVAQVAFCGMVFYALRAVRGDPAWGMAEAWVWEGAGMAGLGLLLTMLGGTLQLERDEKDRSLVGLCGGALTMLSLALMFASLMAQGSFAAYLGGENTARLDAFNVALLIGAATAWAAWRWLKFELGRWLAPAQLVAAYGLALWAWHVNIWECYTIPAGLLCLFWAWQRRASSGNATGDSRIWQILGCTLLLLPSFGLAMPYTQEALWHFAGLVTFALLLVGGAMWARVKVPLLSASAALLLCTLVKTTQWAAHREALLPIVGIGVGFGVLAVGCLFESRMNRALRTAADQVRAQAKMFWVSWE